MEEVKALTSAGRHERQLKMVVELGDGTGNIVENLFTMFDGLKQGIGA